MQLYITDIFQFDGILYLAT